MFFALKEAYVPASLHLAITCLNVLSLQILGRIIGPVLTVTLFTVLVCYASTKGYKLVLINSIVPLLSVVVSPSIRAQHCS